MCNILLLLYKKLSANIIKLSKLAESNNINCYIINEIIEINEDHFYLNETQDMLGNVDFRPIHNYYY